MTNQAVMNDLRMRPKIAVDTPSEIAKGGHLISAFVGNSSGPTLIVMSCIHGNEPAGALALSQLTHEMAELEKNLKGRVYFLRGNPSALSKQMRFIDADLNRQWTALNLSNLRAAELLDSSEGVALNELDQILDGILITAMDEVFVLDLHSTSAEGTPFATVGDTLRNRKFAQKFPVTILLGIEEQIDGTMLEYLNNVGAVTLGFEGGQHDSNATVQNHISVVWLALENAGILSNIEVRGQDHYRRWPAAAKRGSSIVEVRYREAINDGDEFEMNPGFNNFDPVTKGQVLARNKHGVIRATETGLILMPLYQKQGSDGFFIGREISPFWLWLSGVLRGIGIQKIIHILPGVARDPDDGATLNINTRVARLFPLQIFHLLGFRRRRWAGNKLVVSRRRHDTSGPFRWNGNN